MKKFKINSSKEEFLKKERNLKNFNFECLKLIFNVWRKKILKILIIFFT